MFDSACERRPQHGRSTLATTTRTFGQAQLQVFPLCVLVANALFTVASLGPDHDLNGMESGVSNAFDARLLPKLPRKATSTS